jgi:putative tricarboxylic transport membrane protein
VAEQTPSGIKDQGAWERPVSARLGELLTAAALLATGLFFVWQSALLPLGTKAMPGPGIFPFVLCIALSPFSLVILVRNLPRSGQTETVHLGHRDVLVVFAALIALAAGFERLGAYVSLGVFTAVLLLLVARSALWRVVLAVSLGTVAVWAVFKVLLGVQLPGGPF